MELPAPNSSPTPTPRLSEWCSEGFTLFGREWKTWTLQGLIHLVLSLAPAAPGLVLVYSALEHLFAQIPSPGGPSGEFPAIPTDLFVGLGALIVGGSISSILGVYLLAGMTRTAMKQLRGEPIRVGDLFTSADVLLPDLGAYIFLSLVLGLAFSVCVLPGLWLLGLWLFVHPLLVERRLSLPEAFRQSGAATRPHLALYILWAVLIGVVFYAGSVLFIGVVATLPLAVLMWMISYRDTFGLPGALPAPGAPPASPQHPSHVPPTTLRRCPRCERPVSATASACTACGTPL